MRQSPRTTLTKCGVARAAEIMETSEAAIYMRVQRRQLPFRKMGRNIFFFEEELFQFLEKQPGLRIEDITVGQTA